MQLTDSYPKFVKNKTKRYLVQNHLLQGYEWTF